MSRAHYTGAHAAKPASRAPAQKAPPRVEKPEKKAPAEKAERRVKPASKAHRPKAAPVRRPRRRPRKRLVFFLAAIAAALLLAAVAILTPRPAEESAYEENMEKAMAAYEEEDFDNALRYLRRAAAYEESDECLMLMAACYEREDMLDKALDLLRRVNPAQTEATERIQELEQRKTRQKTADTVEVLGLHLPPDTTDLVLDGRNLRDEDLEEVVRLYALDSLSLIGNELSDVSALTALGSLDVLNLSGNEISDLTPLGRMTGLRALYLDGNPLGDLTPLSTLQNLNTLSVIGCGISENQLRTLAAALPACAILSDAADKDVSDITLGGVTFRSDVRELDLSGRGIRDIGALAACKDLQWLNLSDNQITELQGLMNLPRLSSLDISANLVGDLRPLMGLETLRTLKAADNALLDTSALSAMNGLQTLDLSNNAITDFSGLRRLNNLTSLRLVNTGLNDTGLGYLSGLTMLTQLSIEGNPGLSNEAFGALKSSLPSCQISHSELVYAIQIGEHTVASNVTDLDLSGRGVTDLSGIERLDRLESLDLSRNQISNLYVLQLSASRQSLKRLNLSFNQIGDISPLMDLVGLESLSLYGNPILSVQPLLQMTWLQRLNVGSCGLSEVRLSELREALPNCEIVLEAE